MPDKPKKPSSRTFWRRCRRVGASCLVILILVGVSGYWYLLSPTRVAHMACVELEKMTGGEVSVGSARLDISGTLHLTDVSIRARQLSGEGAEIFHTEDIVLICDRKRLYRGEVYPTSIRLRRPTFTLAEIVTDDPAQNPTDRLFNIQFLKPVEEAGPEAQEQWPELPRIEVEDARIRYGTIHGVQFVVGGEIHMRGQVSADDSKAGLFHLSLVEMQGVIPREDGLKITGSVDIEKLIAQAQVDGLALTPRYRALMPSTAQTIWKNVDATGNLPRVQFAYDPENRWRALVRFDGVQMLLPELPGADRRYRMTGVKGALRFEPHRIRITEPLIGDIEGLSYTVAGSIHGYDSASPFEIGLETEPFDIPTEQQDIYALPLPIQEVFRMLTPSGKLDRVTMNVWRKAGTKDEPGEISYGGTATIYGAKARYFKFPYELQQCHGKIAFDAEEIRVLSLAGKTAGGGVATIYGTVTSSPHAPAVDLHITAVDVPLDKELYNALDPKFRPALDLFFSQEAYAQMAKQGHFISFQQYNELEEEASHLRRQISADDVMVSPQQKQTIRERLEEIGRELEKPAFDLGGRANLVARVTRAPTADARSVTVADVDVQEASMVFKHFPYPLMVSSGRLHIEPGLLTFTDVVAKGLHGGECGLRGTVRIPTSHDDDDEVEVAVEDKPPHPLDVGQIRPNLKVHALGIPVDELLLDTLPRPQDRWVRDLRPEGKISMVGRIYHRHDVNRPDVDLLIDLDKARAAPGGGKFKLDRLEGRVSLSLGDARLENVKGYRGESSVVLNGKAHWEGEKKQIDLKVQATQLDFSDPLLDLLEPYVEIDKSWQAFVQERKPQGAFDASLAFRQIGEDDRQARVEISPKAISYLTHDKRVSLTQTNGKVIVEADHARIEKLTGKLGECDLAINGRLTFEPQREADLKVQVRGNRVSDELNNALPPSVLKLVGGLKLDGKFELDLTKAHIIPEAAKGELQTEIAGVLRLSGGKADLGLEIDGIDGLIKFEVAADAGSDYPTIKARIDADRVAIRGRPITSVTAGLQSALGGKALKLSELRGRMYGGAVAGDGAVWLDKHRYEFRMALSGVPLNRFIYQDKPAEKDQAKMEGNLSASFSVEGDWTKANSLRGRGRIQVSEGEMYSLPLALGLLQITHLSLPTSKSFERADVSYYLKAGKLVFERIVLESPRMRMAGDGSLDVDGEKLDLTLTSSNPSALDLGPVSEMVDAFRDQFVTVRVTGTLEDPKREIKPFNGLTKAWRDVFGEGEEP